LPFGHLDRTGQVRQAQGTLVNQAEQLGEKDVEAA